MRKYLALASIMALTLTGCSCIDLDPFGEEEASSDQPVPSSFDVPPAPAEDLPQPVLGVHGGEVTNIVQEVSERFKHQGHLNLQDARTYFNEEGIQTIQLQYISQDILDMCGARKLIIDLVDGLSTSLNENPYLIPEFPNFGFFPDNFEIYIVFESFYNRYVDPYYIRWICMEDGQIAYYAANLTDNSKNCWSVRRESFYTSRDIVFYQRKAETDYKEAHKSDLSIFGDKIYVPKSQQKESHDVKGYP